MPYTREKFKVFAWDKTGTERRTLPQECVGDGTSWTDDRDGGYSSGSLNVQYRDDDEPDIMPGDRVEFWYDDLRRYRGYVRRINIAPGDTNRVTYQLAGIMQIAGTNPVTKRYAGGFDVSQIAAKMVQDTLLKPGAVLQGGLQVNARAISITSDGADFYGQTLYDALRGLNEQSAKAAAWGSSVDNFGRDEFYFQPISPIITPDHTIILPVENITEANSDLPLEDVVNEIQVISNVAPKFPNLIFNPGFEKPVLTGASGVNLFRNGDFEEDDTYWDFQGGADIKESGQTEGSPFSGSKMAEIDSGDEVIEYDSTPAVAVVPGLTYRFAFRAKREVAQLTTPTYGATYTLGFTDGSGLMTGYRQEDLLDDDGTVYNSVVWKRWEWQAVAPAGATGVYFKIDGQDGLDTGDGILIDSIECFDVSEVYQEGWEAIANGTSVVESVDWACEDPHEGGYCVAITVTASDSDANEVYLVQKGGAKFSVIGGQTLRFLAHLKGISGETSPKCRLYIQSWDSSQTSLGIDSYDISSGSLTGEWQYFSTVSALPQSAASALAWVSIRGSGTVKVDSLRCSDGAYSSEVGGIDVYIPDGNYISPIFKAVELFGPSGAAGDNSDPSDLYYDVYNSAAYYGRRIKLVQVNDVSSTDAAQAFAIEWLKSNAIAYPSPSITMVNPTVFYLPGQCIRLVGRNGRKLYTGGLPVARVSYSFSSGTGLSATIQLAREVRDEANLIQRLIERNARRGTTPALSYSGASPGSSAGGSWSGGGIPLGGVTNEALIKSSGADYDTEWQELVPAGGSAGAVLMKDSGTDFDSKWQTVVPSGGAEGQVLQKASGSDWDTAWYDQVTPRPTWKKSLVTPDLSSYSGFNLSETFYRNLGSATLVVGKSESGTMRTSGWDFPIPTMDDFDYVLCVDATRRSADYHQIGIGTRRTDTSGSTFISITDNAGATFAVEVVKMSSASTFIGVVGSMTYHNAAGEIWLRIRKSGGTLYYSVSASGNDYDWSTIFSESVSAWASSNHTRMGVIVASRSATKPKFLLTSLSLEDIYDCTTAVAGSNTDSSMVTEVQPFLRGTGAIAAHTWTARKTGTYRIWVEVPTNSDYSTYKVDLGSGSVGNLIDGITGDKGWNIVDTGVDIAVTDGATFTINFNKITSGTYYGLKRVYLR